MLFVGRARMLSLTTISVKLAAVVKALRKPRETASMKRRKSRVVRATDIGNTALEKLALGQLNRHLGYFLRRVQIWVFLDFIQMMETVKVRPAQYSVMLIIEANPGRSQSAIGHTLGIERARLARLLHELERRNWVSRRASVSDGRSHSLHLTGKGRDALAKIKDLAERHENQLARYLGHRRHKQLMALLRDFG
jgi:DNA-binding MarR family transcriptional regulator